MWALLKIWYWQWMMLASHQQTIEVNNTYVIKLYKHPEKLYSPTLWMYLLVLNLNKTTEIQCAKQKQKS
jgi:hypothetical protein